MHSYISLTHTLLTALHFLFINMLNYYRYMNIFNKVFQSIFFIKWTMYLEKKTYAVFENILISCKFNEFAVLINLKEHYHV